MNEMHTIIFILLVFLQCGSSAKIHIETIKVNNNEDGRNSLIEKVKQVFKNINLSNFG